jgi:ADP-ribose pyrophosphatase YjhB (NUDIX family)
LAALDSTAKADKVGEQPQHHSSLLVDFEELGKAAFNSGIEKPVNGLGQFVSGGHLPELHILEPDAHATGAEKWFQTAGSAIGTIADFAALTAVAATGVGAIAEIPAAGAALASVGSVVGGTAVAEGLATSAVTGAVYGGVLTPLAKGENQWDRLSNAATMTATFVTLGGLSSALGFTGTSVVGAIERKGLASAGAGIVDENMASLTTGHGFASASNTLRAGITWGLSGAAMATAGEAISAGSSWLTSKFAAVDTKGEPGTSTGDVANSAGGKAENVSWQTGPDGKVQLSALKLSDGTQLLRNGTSNSWVANPNSENAVTWQGDVSLKPDGTPSFTYAYEKAASHVSLALQLSDGSKVAAVNSNGEATLPDSTLQATNQRLPETALQSIKALGLNVSPDRLQLQGVTTSNIIQTQYSLNANPEESAQILKAVGNNPSFKIVPADQPLVPPSALTPSPTTISGASDIGENQAGSYQYSEPMADHTSTVSFLFQGDDGQWKTLTGLRERPPAQGQEALPGGFLDMKNGTVEAPEHAAAREMGEETGLKITNPVLLRVGDALGRDNRNRIIDFQYAAFGDQTDLTNLAPLDDLKDLKVRDVQQLLANPKSLAFDHYQVLQDAYKLALERQRTAAVSSNTASTASTTASTVTPTAASTN